MAVIKTAGVTAKPRNPVYTVGKKLRTVNAVVTLVSANMANGDIVELAGPFTLSSRIARIISPASTPALTAATDAKLGFFKKNSAGALVVVNTGSDAVLWNGVTLATAISGNILLVLNSSLDKFKTIGELLALGEDNEPSGGVYLGLTFPTKPTAGGTLDLDIVIEEATNN